MQKIIEGFIQQVEILVDFDRCSVLKTVFPWHWLSNHTPLQQNGNVRCSGYCYATTRCKEQPQGTRIVGNSWITTILLTVALILTGCNGGSVFSGGMASDSGEVVHSETIFNVGLCLGGETAQLIKITDGDTIRVRMVDDGREERVRYIGINTPETDEPCGSEATERNRQLVEGEMLILVKDTSERDRYDRLLRYVCRADNVFINAQLVADGYAESKRFPPDTALSDEFDRLEAEAKVAGRGCLYQP